MLSCEQGICGSCITDVIDGIPDHRDCVLTDEEKAANTQITLCCSRSKSPVLVLDLQSNAESQDEYLNPTSPLNGIANLRSPRGCFPATGP
ncbi:Phthalate dioxygenase reductase [Raoultella terrigena]|uniref:Phthalate dioxygenase reductase n=1 Tax=Raoultella terrigena TaxID=577 RepID=A0A4U9CZ84_RAOTE|nr:Phthalate dioxygenase reductase [Raoultella terrigena]